MCARALLCATFWWCHPCFGSYYKQRLTCIDTFFATTQWSFFSLFISSEMQNENKRKRTHLNSFLLLFISKILLTGACECVSRYSQQTTLSPQERSVWVACAERKWRLNYTQRWAKENKSLKKPRLEVKISSWIIFLTHPCCLLLTDMLPPIAEMLFTVFYQKERWKTARLFIIVSRARERERRLLNNSRRSWSKQTGTAWRECWRKFQTASVEKTENPLMS